jgi:hypothetical protein
MNGQQRITHIPVKGGSGRVPTGAIQFADDWPGLFLRGDAAIPLLISIRELQRRLEGTTDVGLLSALLRLDGIANIIERDVVVRSHQTRSSGPDGAVT